MLRYFICEETDTVLSCLPRRLTPRCPAYHGDWHCAVLPTTETDSALSCLPGLSALSCPSQRLTQRCPSHRRGWLHVVLPTTETDSALSCLPQWLNQHFPVHLRDSLLDNLLLAKRMTPCCPAHHGDWLCVVLHTVQQRLTLCCPAHRRDWLHAALLPRILTSFVRSTAEAHSARCLACLRDWLCAVLQTSETDSALFCTPQRLTPRKPA